MLTKLVYQIHFKLKWYFSFLQIFLGEFGEMRDYSFNLIIKKYCRFPVYLPIPFYMEHGWTPSGEAIPSDLRTKKKLMLVFNTKREEAWKAKSNIPVVIMGSPFIHYRRHNGLVKELEAKGTIAFPGHSCETTDIKYSIGKYCNSLLSLNEAFHPITICLHDEDIRKGAAESFSKFGFEIECAGSRYDIRFVQNFYNILNRHQYATSNEVGSYTFYAVEMGIPFFILGEIPISRKIGSNPDIPSEFSILTGINGKIAYDLFNTGPVKHISETQKNYVYQEMGIDSCISQTELKKIFWSLFNFREFMGFVLKLIFNKFFLKYPRLLNNRFDISKKCYMILHRLGKENRIFTHLRLIEKIALHKILKREQKDLICVEIGSFLGASSCFIANAISENSKLICIDTWGNQNMKYDKNDTDAEERDTYNEFIVNTKKYRRKITEIRKWSSDAIEDIKNITNQIDFLFIDGDHNYEGVKVDWDLYKPLLRDGSLIAFHDTGWAEGVQKVIYENVIGISDLVIKLPNLEIYRIINVA